MAAFWAAGATVIGLASEPNHEWLASHGVIPVSYGEGVEERIRAASGGRVDAFIDTVGGGYVDLAIALGVAPQRIDISNITMSSRFFRRTSTSRSCGSFISVSFR